MQRWWHTASALFLDSAQLSLQATDAQIVWEGGHHMSLAQIKGLLPTQGLE